MMRSIVLPIFLLLLIFFSGLNISAVGAEDDISYDRGIWHSPEITSFDISVSNDSGTFKFRMDLRGTAPPGTEHVELSAGVANGTRIDIFDEIWVEEGNFMLFGNGYKLETLGDESEPWSNWSFHASLTVPMDMDLDLLTDLLGGIIGFDIGDLDITENGSIPDFDAGELLQDLAETEIFAISRAYNSSGAWGQDAMEVTDDILIELLSFASDEGWISDPGSDDDDDDTVVEEEQTDEGNAVLIAAAAGLAVLLLISIIITVAFVMIKTRSDR